MIVNGVTLPDIPAEVLEQYPYAVMFHRDETDGWVLAVAVSEYAYLLGDLIDTSMEGLRVVTSSGAGASFSCYQDSTAWNQTATHEAGKNLITIGSVNVETGVESTTMAVVWANHDIYEVTSIDTSTGEFVTGEIYFPNSETPETEYAERYSILGSILVGTARQIMRLTDSTTKVKPEEFEPKLEGINIQLQELTVTATEEQQTITPPSGVYGFSKVIVEAVEDSGSTGGGGTPGGGEGGDDTGPTISNGDNFAFGDNYIEQTVYTGMATYPTTNGDKKLPAPVGGEYKIISQSSGTYYLYTAPVRFYTTGKYDSPDTIDNSDINYYAATQNDSEWTYKGTWSVAGEPIWTSHDLYDRNNTVLYVPKSDNYTLESTTAIVPTPVECEDSYEVSSESLNSIVGTVQKLTNTTEPMTLTEVAEALSEYAEANGFT